MKKEIYEMEELLSKTIQTTQDSWNEMLEAFTKLKHIECYQEFSINCENKMREYAKSLN